MSSRFRGLLGGLVALTGLFASGCGDSGPKLYSVKGSVKVDGKPAANATVFLHRKGRTDLAEPTPYGRCGADGTFAVTTTKDGDGAQVGDYSVTVVWPDMSKEPNGSGERPDLLRGTYAGVGNSAIKATVEAKDNTLPDIALTAPKGPAPKEPIGVKSDK